MSSFSCKRREHHRGRAGEDREGPKAGERPGEQLPRRRRHQRGHRHEVNIPAEQMETSDRVVQLVALPAVPAREREIQSALRRRHDQHRPNRERANPRRSATAANGRVTSAIALGSLGASTTGSTDIDGPPSSGQGFAEGSRPASGKSLIRLRRIPLVTLGGHAATSKGGRLRSSCGSAPIGYDGALAGISVLVSARSGLMRAST